MWIFLIQTCFYCTCSIFQKCSPWSMSYPPFFYLYDAYFSKICATRHTITFCHPALNWKISIQIRMSVIIVFNIRWPWVCLSFHANIDIWVKLSFGQRRCMHCETYFACQLLGKGEISSIFWFVRAKYVKKLLHLMFCIVEDYRGGFIHNEGEMQIFVRNFTLGLKCSKMNFWNYMFCNCNVFLLNNRHVPSPYFCKKQWNSISRRRSYFH